MKKVKKVIMFLILIAVIAGIFIFSSHTGTESSAISSKITRLISRIIFRNFSEMSLSQQEFIVSELDPFVRKLAHFTVYALLGALMYWFIMLTELRLPFTFILSWVFCTIYAASDEYHQSFTPGRSMNFRDVVIDSSGALCGIIAAMIIVIVFRYIVSGLKASEGSKGTADPT